MSAHYTEGRRWSHISNAWILVEGWNDKEEIASLRARIAAITSESAAEVKAARFENVFCSQCGRDFGPGENGFSHCRNHAGKSSKA